MALTPETFEVLKQSREYLLQRSNDVTYGLTQAWVDAWDSIQPELEAAARGLAGSDPRSALLARRAALVGDTAGVLVSDALYATGEGMSSAMVAAVANAEKQQILAASTQVPPDQAASFGASLNRVDPLQLEAIVMRGTEAIMVGWSAMPVHVQSAVRTNLFKGVAFGLHPTVVARKIMDNAQGAFAGGLSRAIRVARTEMLDAHRNASGAWRQSNKNVLAGWRWLATLDTRTCPSCLAKNGNLYEVDDPGPLDHPNGRCDAVPETKSWKDLGIDGVEEPPSTFPDARAWYDGLSPEAQKSIMGPSRQALLADGKIGWDDLSTRVSSRGWRDSYTTTSLRDLQTKAQPPAGVKFSWDKEMDSEQFDSVGDAMESTIQSALQGTGYSVRRDQFIRGPEPQFYWDVVDSDGNRVGEIARTIEDQGREVHNSWFSLDPDHQGKGIASKIGPALEDLYRRSGVERISLHANVDVGGYTWAKKGFGWHPKQSDSSTRSMLNRAEEIVRDADGDSPHLATIDGWREAVRTNRGDRSKWPLPYDIAMLGWTPGATSWPGKEAMLKSSWRGVKIL